MIVVFRRRVAFLEVRSAIVICPFAKSEVGELLMETVCEIGDRGVVNFGFLRGYECDKKF
jgi:hypothetical protein